MSKRTHISRWVVVILIGFIASPLCCAQTWVQVKHGAFATPEASLIQMKATLRDTITSAIRAKGEKPREWSRYLIQYRGARVRGLRAIEIRGSCRFEDKKFDTRSEFYEVSDGGVCYSLVYYILKTGRYSNVVFHGVA
jgi:hypothetical protein